MRNAKLQSKIQNYFKLLAVIFIFSLYALCLVTVNAAAPSELKNTIDQKTQELQQLNSQIKETQKQIENTQGQKSSLNKEIKQLDYNINQLNLNIKSSEINIQKLNLELSSLKYDINDIESGIIQRKSAISQLLRRVQEKDNENLLLAVLKNQSLAQSVAEFQTIVNLNQNLSVEIGNLDQLHEKFQLSLNKTSQKKNQVGLEKNNLQNRQTIVLDQKKSRQTLLSQTKNKEQLYQLQLKELEKQQEKIGAEIEKIEEQLRATMDPSLMPMPRPGVFSKPIEGILSQKYGRTSFAERAYKSGFHNGIDFAAPIGTPVFAARDGKIVATGDNGRVQYGKFIVIEHDNNLSTLYSHLSRQVAAKGSFVKKGDLIGYSGNTGYVTGPHLHLTVYISQTFFMKAIPTCFCGLVPVGATIDPLDYL
ncbi:MAG: peptidoglycan DD-metalloendopeptidase family protein [Patescibacteria group bacterium]